MKIGIFIFSKSGNTAFVAKKAQQALTELGHEAELVMIEPSDSTSQSTIDINAFKTLPIVEGYDAYIFGSSVEAFALNKAMKFIINQMNNINAKAVCLTTQLFMTQWMGGNQAQKQMKALLEAKGGIVLGGTNISWRVKKGRDDRIQAAVQTICDLLK